MNRTTLLQRARERWIVLAAALAVLAVLLAANGVASRDGAAAGTVPVADVHAAVATQPDAMTMAGSRTASESALYAAMQTLWDQHMEWTYATIAAFAAGTKGVGPTLTRLLRNQVDIGNAVKPFYGTAAGDRLTVLLKKHINGVVAILSAAVAGHAKAQSRAIAAEEANAKAIGDFLANANPANWPKADMERMMHLHIGQTLVYATDQLKGNYVGSIREYGKAEAHMLRMGQMLAAGLIAQFPARFTG
jgi:hypothetical protein